MCWELGEVSRQGGRGGWWLPRPVSNGAGHWLACAFGPLPRCPQDLVPRCPCQMAGGGAAVQTGVVALGFWSPGHWSPECGDTSLPPALGLIVLGGSRFHTDSYNWILQILGHGATAPRERPGTQFQRRGLGHLFCSRHLPPSAPDSVLPWGSCLPLLSVL